MWISGQTFVKAICETLGKSLGVLLVVFIGLYVVSIIEEIYTPIVRIDSRTCQTKLLKEDDGKGPQHCLLEDGTRKEFGRWRHRAASHGARDQITEFEFSGPGLKSKEEIVPIKFAEDQIREYESMKEKQIYEDPYVEVIRSDLLQDLAIGQIRFRSPDHDLTFRIRCSLVRRGKAHSKKIDEAASRTGHMVECPTEARIDGFLSSSTHKGVMCPPDGRCSQAIRQLSVSIEGASRYKLQLSCLYSDGKAVFLESECRRRGPFYIVGIHAHLHDRGDMYAIFKKAESILR